MYYVYLLKSLQHNWYYVGLTNNLERRLNQHNNGDTTSTKFRKPFELVFNKEFPDRISARDYEKFLKVRFNKEKLIRELNL